jgi:hypothetical protein
LFFNEQFVNLEGALIKAPSFCRPAVSTTLLLQAVLDTIGS